MSNNGKTILIVEDEAIIAVSTATLVESFGYKSILAYSGVKAVELARENSDISLILMDIDLGIGMDGTQAAKTILEFRDIPIVFLTSHLEAEYVNKVREITRYGYVIKDSGDFVLQSSIEMAYELFEANRKTNEQKEYLDTTLKSIGDAVITTDEKSLVISMNDIASQLTGWKIEEAVGKPLSTVFRIVNSHTGLAADNPVAKALVEGRIVGLANHTLLISKDGTEYQIADSAAPIKNSDGNILGVVLVFRDVTEDYFIRHKLAESEKMYHSLFNAMPEGVCQHRIVYDDSGEAVDYLILDVNNRYEEILGLQRENVIGRLASVVYNTDPAPYLKEYAEVSKTGVPYFFEVYFPPMNKHFSISVFSPEKGTFATVFTDITAKKEAEYELKERARQLDIALNTSLMGVWQWDLTSGNVEWMGEFDALFGRPRDTFRGRIKQLLSYAESSDKQEMVYELKKAIKTEAKFHFKNRIIWPDGKVRWLSTQAKVLFGGNKKAHTIIGITHDITEQELVQRNYLDVIDTMHEMLYITTSDGDILFANENAAQTLADCTPMEIEGRNIMEFIPFTSAEKLKAFYRDVVSSGRSNRNEINLNLGRGSIWLSNSMKRIEYGAGSKAAVLNVSLDMTEIKKAEASRLESEGMFRTILESSRDLSYRLNLITGTYDYLSPVSENIMGYTPEEFIAMGFEEVEKRFHPDDREKYRKHFDLLLSGTSEDDLASIIEYRWRHRNGTYHWYSDNRSLLYNEKGKPVAIAGNVRDVTGIKKAEEELYESQARYKAFVEHAQEGIYRVDFTEKIDISLPEEEFIRAVNERAVVIEVNNSLSEMYGLKPGDMNNKPAIEFAPDYGRRALGMIHDEEYRFKGETEDIDKDGNAVYLMESFHGEVENGFLLRVWGVQTNITERRHSEDVLKQNELLMREMTNSMEKALAIYEPVANGRDFRFVYMNEYGEKITHYRIEDILGKTVRSLFPGESSVGLIGKLRETFLTGKSTHIPLKQYQDNRITQWVENYIFKLPSGKVAAMFEDTREQKMMEAALMESEDKFRSYVRYAPYGIFVADENGNYVEANIAACEVTGYSEGELLGKNLTELIVERDKRKAYEHFKSLANNRTMRGEFSFIRKDGTERRWTVSAVALSPTRFLGFVNDVTEKYIVEQELILSHQCIRQMPDAVIRTSLNGFILDWTGSAETVFGYTKSEALGRPVNFLHRPDVRKEQTIEIIQSIKKYNLFKGEIPCIRKDGKEIPIELIAKAVHDKNGEALAIIGINRDISERKRAREKIESLLREKELMLREVHHRIKNNMTVIRSLLSLQVKKTKLPEAISAINDAIGRVESMQVLYDKLYQTEKYKEVSTHEYFSGLIHEILFMLIEPGRVRVNENIQDFPMPVKIAFPCGIIINELLTNSVKHGLNGDGGEIDVQVIKDEAKVSLIYSDSGDGFRQNLEKMPKGFGLMLIDMLTKQLDGKFRIENNGRTRFIIEFDMKK